MSLKNNVLSPRADQLIEDGFHVLTYENDADISQPIVRHVDASLIQFHFCFRGSATFHFNQRTYNLPLLDEHVLLLYNPQRDLPMELDVSPNSQLVTVLISIKKFHSLFSQEANQISFLSDENADKKYYKDHIITPSMAVALSQILQYQPNTLMSRLYLKGKVYELLSLYFNPTEATDVAECPFLVDEENVRKIRNAKKIVLERMINPPSLQDLADEIGLSLKKLKEGFKQLYGSTVYQFILDHKMNHARQLLGSGSYNVNEVALQLGYSNSSHFIDAFKKKFGTTPKKYLLSVSS
ncbi:MAG: AraC family transcriptional regulator [Bacteroidetes bacterium]|nr:AraC family transcriptional regulator [Bacteroidota bacterium]MDA0889025.1 AraC family transcriptional regulator [Bacteroidota bacterium]MDA1084818.1 AraC family transcriptional regulator [Bacteroidota bacterium]